MLLSLLFISLVSQLTTVWAVDCPEGFAEFSPSNRCFFVEKRAYKRREAADNDCISKGATLAVLHTKEETRFVQELAKSEKSYLHWIGLKKVHDIENPSSGQGWVWSNGETLNYGVWNEATEEKSKNSVYAALQPRITDEVHFEQNPPETIQPYICSFPPVHNTISDQPKIETPIVEPVQNSSVEDVKENIKPNTTVEEAKPVVEEVVLTTAIPTKESKKEPEIPAEPNEEPESPVEPKKEPEILSEPKTEPESPEKSPLETQKEVEQQNEIISQTTSAPKTHEATTSFWIWFVLIALIIIALVFFIIYYFWCNKDVKKRTSKRQSIPNQNKQDIPLVQKV